MNFSAQAGNLKIACRIWWVNVCNVAIEEPDMTDMKIGCGDGRMHVRVIGIG
jgi:hypothetical protein